MRFRPKMTKPVLKVMVNVLANQRGFHCGADITRETGVPPGTLYPLLHRLEVAGWVLSKKEDVEPTTAGRPAKRFYRLTAEGQKALAIRMHRITAELRTGPAWTTPASAAPKP
jgi:DNA-binding PadR family transcriptional regulator